jgi:hypothetical protein
VNKATNTEETILGYADSPQDSKVQTALHTWLPQITSGEGMFTLHTGG